MHQQMYEASGPGHPNGWAWQSQTMLHGMCTEALGFEEFHVCGCKHRVVVAVVVVAAVTVEAIMATSLVPRCEVNNYDKTKAFKWAAQPPPGTYRPTRSCAPSTT